MGPKQAKLPQTPLRANTKLCCLIGQKYTMRAVAKDFIAEGDNIDLTGKVEGLKEIKGKQLKISAH